MVDILGERGWIYRKNHAILKDIAPVDAEWQMCQMCVVVCVEGITTTTTKTKVTVECDAYVTDLYKSLVT